MMADPRNAALQAEYLHLQKTIEDFDGRALTIKAWSVTFGLVAVAGAFASHASVPFLIAVAGAAIFWILEAQWKLFQTSYYARVEAIESHFRGETTVEHPFQIAHSWYRAWSTQRFREFPRVASWPHVALPHVIVILLGLLLFVLASAQLIKL
jgi:hypothetical protein